MVDDEIFIHILANTEDIRDYYIPIEPCLFGNVESLMEKIEHRLVNFVEELEDRRRQCPARLKVILEIVDRLVMVMRNGKKISRSGPEKEKGCRREKSIQGNNAKAPKEPQSGMPC